MKIHDYTSACKRMGMTQHRSIEDKTNRFATVKGRGYILQLQ